MPLIVQPATEADAVRSAQIEKAAYSSSPFNSTLFPGPFPQPAPGKNPRAEEMVRLASDDPSVRWLKVVDTDIPATEDNAQMIGFAQWNINDGSERPAQRRTFGPGCNAEACEALFGGLYELRLKHYTGVKHVHLTALHVDPHHQRRGAGKLLVMWGIEEAKKLDLPGFLESTEEGHTLYKSCGFRDFDKQAIDFTKWGVPQEAVTYFMALKLGEAQ
ncbi:acyl-CoA N-acyltransferase [Nemania sp. NC0429]|nr:acyl-CoA N-acyltransferase [Nemania sp. NC0429]